MAPPIGLAMALILIAGAFDRTSAEHSFHFSRGFEVPEGAQLAPLPVIPLPAGLSTLLPSHNRPLLTTPRPRPLTPSRPILLSGSQGGRPLPSAHRPPPFPQRPSRPTAVPFRPTPGNMNPTPPPPPPAPTLPSSTRPTPPPPPRPRPRPSSTRRPSTTLTPTTPRPVAPTGGTQGGDVKDMVFSVFKMSDDGSYLFDYTAPSVGLRQREEGFLKTIGDLKVPVKRGFFAYTSADGKPISLSYEADELGFRATGDHLPKGPLPPSPV